MTKQTNSTKKNKLLDEIIGNATDLPPDSQEVILMIAKSMKYTRECIMKECDVE